MKRGGIIFLALMLALSLASASFSNGNFSITKDYGPAETLRGWINISFNNHPSNAIIETSLGSINLIDLLKGTSNSGFSYTCNPLECTSAYIANNEGTEKTFNLAENQSVFLGFKFTGKNIGQFSGFSINLSSNNPETEKLPLAIDFLNDGVKEWQAYSSSESFGPENFGCFVIPTGQAFISTNTYCERITLKKTPEVEIGAYVTYITGNKNVNFQMRIQNVFTGETQTCQAYASGTGRISCIPFNFQVKENGDYFVCLQTKLSSDTNKYKIDYEEERTCGFSGTDYQSADGYYDFEIFARPKKYSSSINIKLDDAELARAKSPVSNIESYLESYIHSEYNNCSNGCIIPVKITSGIEQEITLYSMNMFFIKDGIAEETNSIFNVEETPAGISSSFQKLYLDDADFQVPSEYGNYTFEMAIDNKSVFSDEISVGEVPTIKSLTPSDTAVKYPTTFYVDAESSKNISQYSWDFGDGSAGQTTTTGEASHTYNSAATYTIKVEVRDSKGKSSSKEFSVYVGPASEIVPSIIEKTEMSITKIKNQIMDFSQFEKESITTSLGLDTAESQISQLKTSLAAAASESDYEAILGSLLAMRIPDSLAKTASSSGLYFSPEAGNVNPGAVEEIMPSGTYEASKDSLYQDAILAWENSNINIMMDYSEFSSAYGTNEFPFLKVFKLHITNSGTDHAYIIIREMAGLTFDKDYSEKSINGYAYIDMASSEEDITFSTTENVDFLSLPAFISPSLDMLTIADYTPYEKESETGKWIVFSVIIFLIILAALGVYTFLQVWYTRKYETSLFKDRNNLFNLINFINDAKKKEEKDEEIAEKLKKSGWNSEQIKYALKKYAGKNTGLPEIIPIGKILDNLKKKQPKKPPATQPRVNPQNNRTNPQGSNFTRKI